MAEPPGRTVARPVANLGNTCYMNAVLQALAHAPELCLAMDCEAHRSTCPIAAEKKEKIRRSSSPDGSASSAESPEPKRPAVATRKSRRSGRKSPPDTSVPDESFCALCELEEHLELVHDSSKRDKPVAPTSFVHGFIDRVAPWFRLGVQEDSHEFLRLLIDAMQKSCEKARPPLPTGGSPSKIEDDKEAPSGASDSTRDEKDHEYPFSLFRGTVESTVTCGSCNVSSSTLDPIEDVGLEVSSPTTAPPARGGTDRTSSRNVSPTPAPTLYDVETAFRRFSTAEALDAGYKCEKCGKVGKAMKQSRLASIPPILTLHLKRFRYGGGAGAVEPTRRSQRSELGQLLGTGDFAGKSGSAKIEGHCKFNVLFDLQPYLTEELQKNHPNMLCRLFAVVVHAGKNSHSGHYISYVRNISKNEWWKMDDGRVTHVTLDEVSRAEAYMLFYRVVQHPVAIKLEQDYKVISDSRKIQVEEKSQEVEEPKPSVIRNLLGPRKRPLSSSEDGESWLRTKTSMPPYLLGLIRKLEEKIANDVMSRQDVLKLIQESDNDSGSVAVTTNYADKDGCDTVSLEFEKYREDILNALFKISRWLERVKGIPSSDLLTRSSTVADDKRVAVVEPAVVEPEEDIDLL